MRGQADDFDGRITPPNFCDGHIVLSHVYGVRADLRREGGIVVHNEARVRPACEGADFPRRGPNIRTGDVLHAQLQHPNARLNGGGGARLVTAFRVCHHKIESKIFHG